MRLGEEDEARKQLELCYNNGYHERRRVNSLTLLDSYKNYVTYKTATTILRLHKKEAGLLRSVFPERTGARASRPTRRNTDQADRPVQVEVYPDHEDFAVRTMGMPGLGALGVTFGYVVAMDSPSGRKPGSFHWASTMWHELSHVYVLTATKHRVPRWFTEGWRYTKRRPSRRTGATGWIRKRSMRDQEQEAAAGGGTGPRLIRPSYPTQVIVSYFQAGKICRLHRARSGATTSCWR